MRLCYLGLGSNLNNPERQVRNAIAKLRSLPCSSLLKSAPFYRSKAWGRKNLPDYCNTVVALQTRLSPEVLLFFCQKIEQSQGRIRKVRYGARTIDIDILFFGSLKRNSPKLTLPHPRIQERDFVLVPLSQICSDNDRWKVHFQAR
ncbi:MAG: 2-amino-4-hydroxy-6-hydroxymethyldihydropteridine diphosphokinase [Tatlockia sp.]|jgi:2-amino-4-hydroxy-6-hydroxymethyldihydropteridine diphosphokinase